MRTGPGRWFEATGSNLLEDPGLHGIVVNSQDVTERRQAEKALKESERRLVEAQRVAQIGNWDWQVFTDTIVWSEELYRIYGVAPGEFGGTYEDVLEIAHPEDKEHVAKTVGTAYENLSKFRFDHRRVHPDRGLRVLTVRGDVVAGESGEPIRMFGTVQDVTDRKQAENELKGSHDLLQSVMEGTTDAVFVKDLRGRYLMIKRAGAEALGKSVEEIIGKDDIELFSEEDGQEVIEADQEVLAAGETRTTEDTKAAEGQMTRTFLSTKGPYRDGEGNVAGMFGVARDITDRKRYEEALRRSEGSLAAAQRMARVGNLDQVIGGDLYWADELYRIYGFTPKQFVPTYEDAMSVIHPDDKEYIEKTQEEVRRSGEKLQVECRIVRPDGEVQIVQNSFEMDYDETGDLMRIAGTVQDITGRKWEERRRAAHHEVTRVLAETSTLEDAAPKILQAICENLEWEVGEFWNVDWEAGVLRCIQTWNGPNIDVSEFIEATRQTTFSRGEGMPGRIWESGEPAWISDVWDVDNLPRMPIALKAGLRGGFGFPILLGGNVFGVMDFFCPEVRQPDKEVLDMMTAIGSQIGQFIERKNFESQLQHQALHDDPTDLPNRNLFTDRLQHALERAKRRKKSVAVLFLDLDNFKYINDTLGHDTGDQLLAAAAECLKECLRPEDTAARLGGDEFAVLLEEIPEPGEAELVAERILNALSRPFDLENHRQFTSVSIGIVVKNGSDHQPGELLRSADLAMYKAKTTGKNRYALFDLETERRSMQRLEVENDLRASLERDEFRVLYQPLVLLETGQIVGMEALVRWEHPRRGLVTPDEFIPVAEETGMIDHIGEKVLREACRQMRGWQGRYPYSPPLIIGVNLSIKQLQNTDLVDKVENVLRETGLEPESLTLEVTENVLVDDAEGHVHTLAKLRDLGVRFAIDDFGTGYSSLSYLKRLPAGLLKIDGSFVELVTEATEDKVLLRGTIDIAHGLNMSVTAEGVETEEQAMLLKSLGCDLAQGRYFSEPLPAGEAEEILAKHAPLGDLAP